MKKLLLVFAIVCFMLLFADKGSCADTIIYVTIPDANNVEMLATARWLTKNPTMTAIEAKAYYKGYYISVTKDLVREYRRSEYLKQANQVESPDNFVQ